MASAVTSIYEYPISAASAAYAPTNTAEVTAMIDSAVSGKLDASASSAFQPSGDYQTAGDYVSSSELAGYQTTAGMSAYATTAALADKLDASASSAFQPSGDYQTAGDYVSSSELADFQTTAGMSAYQTVDGMSAYQSAGDYATTADLSAKLDASASSAFLTSQVQASWSETSSSSPAYIVDRPAEGTLSAGDYMDISVSGNVVTLGVTGLDTKLDTSAIETSIAGVTGIAGTAIAGGGGGAAIPFIGYYWDSAASATAEITAAVSSVSSLPYEKYDGTKVNAYKGITDTMGLTHLGVASFIEPGAQINNKLSNYTLAFAPASSMWTTAGVATGIYAPLQYGTGAGMFIDNGNFKGYLKGNELFVCNTGIGQAARVEVHQSRGAHLCLTADKHGIVSANFSPTGVALSNGAQHFTANLDASNNRGAALRLYGGTGSASNSQTSMAWLTPTSLQVSNTASGTAKYAINSIALYDTDTSAQKTISSTSIDYWNAKLDASAIECDTASAITAIGGSAIAGGGGGTTYTAGQYIQISGDEISVTGIDPNSYATTADLSAKLDSSASSSFLTAQEQASWSETASSSPSYIVDKPDLVDIVAGPGIVVDNPDGNTLRVSMADENYETVLWSGTPTNSKTLTEPMWNFERIRIEFYDGIGQHSDPYGSPVYAEISVKTTSTHFNVQHCILSDGNFGSDWEMHSIDSNGTGVTLSHMKRVLNGWSQGSFVFQSPNSSLITKIVGIHRIANN